MKHSNQMRVLGLCLSLACGACTSDDGADSATNNLLPRVDGALGKANPPKALGARIDRAGRPAITAALISTFNPDPAAQSAERDRYNTSGNSNPAFVPTIVTSLAILDGLDEACGNQLLAGNGDPRGRYAPLANVLVDDQLYVHSQRAGSGSVYLGLEAETVNAINAGQGAGGGRIPGDDVIARSFSVLVAGELSGLDDGVPRDDAVHDQDVFPFLAAPR